MYPERSRSPMRPTWPLNPWRNIWHHRNGPVGQNQQVGEIAGSQGVTAPIPPAATGSSRCWWTERNARQAAMPCAMRFQQRSRRPAIFVWISTHAESILEGKWETPDHHSNTSAWRSAMVARLRCHHLTTVFPKQQPSPNLHHRKRSLSTLLHMSAGPFSGHSPPAQESLAVYWDIRKCGTRFDPAKYTLFLLPYKLMSSRTGRN